MICGSRLRNTKERYILKASGGGCRVPILLPKSSGHGRGLKMAYRTLRNAEFYLYQLFIYLIVSLIISLCV